MKLHLWSQSPILLLVHVAGPGSTLPRVRTSDCCLVDWGGGVSNFVLVQVCPSCRKLCDSRAWRDRNMEYRHEDRDTLERIRPIEQPVFSAKYKAEELSQAVVRLEFKKGR